MISNNCSVCKKNDIPVVRCEHGHPYCDNCAVVFTQDSGVGALLVTRCMFCPCCQEDLAPAAPVAPKEFICPIRLEVMEYPVVLQDGISYEREEIENWFKTKHTSPTTNARIDRVFVPNFNLRCLIRDWKSL